MKANVVVTACALVFVAATAAVAQTPPKPARIATICGVCCEGAVIEAF